MESRIGSIKVCLLKILLVVKFLLFFNFICLEEILKSQKALWSSNDGFLLVYAVFNDTNVGQMNYPWFSSNPLLQSG